MLELLRAKRMVEGAWDDSHAEAPFTVVVGLYNAEPFLDIVKENLDVQIGHWPILFIDNCSQDRTGEIVSKWIEEYPGRLVIVKNPVNVGAWASFCMNLDLLNSPWFISMHQDDVYKASHVDTLAKRIQAANPAVTCIATDMGSLNNDGTRNRKAPPRASWGLPDTARETLFLTNLRLHNVPNPASAFRVKDFLEFTGPWHSTAFPDTEWLLKALLVGTVDLVPEVTVLYRENPLSESHSIESEQRETGAYLSLSRIFSSREFVDFCREIEPQHRGSFAANVLEGIRVRIGENTKRCLLTVASMEQMAFAWDYSEQLANQVIADFYGNLSANRVIELLKDLDSEYGNLVDPKRVQTTHLSVQVKSSSAQKMLSVVKRLALFGFNLLPYKARRYLFGIYRNSPIVPVSSPWYSKWRRSD